MKILHTGDWHMNDALGRVDRSEDIFAVIAQIAAYLEEYEVDVLLIAGDLFSERSSREQLRRAISRLRELLTPFLLRGGTIVAISGNHDSEIFFETLRDALDLALPFKTEKDNTSDTENFHSGGRLWIAPNPRILTLRDKENVRVQFVLMPYPTARCYLRGSNVVYGSIEEKHRAVQNQFTATLDTLRARIDVTLPSILVSHVHIRGAQTHTLYKVSEVEDVVFDPGDIPTGWAYCAYGHIHKAQAPLPGAPHVRYCGSIERLDGAEANDEKSVVLIDIGPHGRRGEPQILPLNVSTLRRLEIGADGNPNEEVLELAEKFPNHANELLSYRLHWLPGRDNRDELCRQINALFPRWYARELVQSDMAHNVKGESGALDLRDVASNVRDYLESQLEANHPQREAVLKLAESALATRDGGES